MGLVSDSTKSNIEQAKHTIKGGISGLGRVANAFVEKILSISTGLRYTAIVAVVGVLCLTILWSFTSKNKFFPKDPSYAEIQSKAILQALKKEPISHSAHLPSFETRKLQYLQRPMYSPSQLA
jgi:hypothetical protein